MKNNKSLGQHWLNNRAILEGIAELVAGSERLRTGDAEETSLEGASKIADKIRLCIEIGPGLGTLTSSLIKRFERVIAVEYDERLAKNLPRSFPGTNLEVVNGDFLDVDLGRLTSGDKYVIVGNIPYYITSPIIKKVLTAEVLPERVVLLMQKEVAERIVSEKETILSLFVKNRAKVLAGPVVFRGEFTPPPKVDSQVLVLEPHAPEVSEGIFELIQQAFASPRKKLAHNLSGLRPKEELIEIFGRVGISADARPGDLHLLDYQRLGETLGV